MAKSLPHELILYSNLPHVKVTPNSFLSLNYYLGLASGFGEIGKAIIKKTTQNYRWHQNLNHILNKEKVERRKKKNLLLHKAIYKTKTRKYKEKQLL